MSFQTLDDVHADYELLEADDRYRLLIDLGRALEPMPEALKPMRRWCARVRPRSGSIRSRAATGGSIPRDSNAAITRGSSR